MDRGLARIAWRVENETALFEFHDESDARDKKLDSLNNLYSLCRYCHSAVHRAEWRIARKLLSKMYDERSRGFHYGISKLELLQYYSVEEIVKNVDPELRVIPVIES